ncbi:hypothetical protein BH23THE1_BH23THE1_21000 [soil metagenome]
MIWILLSLGLNEDHRTIGELIKNVIQNPLVVTNSIESNNEIRNILTDNNRDNDLLVCELLDSETEYTSNVREILNYWKRIVGKSGLA